MRARRLWQASAVLMVALLMAVVWALSFSDRTAKPMAVGSDQLGMDREMSFADYQSHAAAELASLPTSPDAPAHWALMTLEDAATATELADVIDTAAPTVARVSTLVTDNPPMLAAIPEPSVQADRAEIIDLTLSRTPAGATTTGTRIRSAVVYGTPAQLRALDEQEEVVAVEPLPDDASFGRFAIRPVTVAEPSAAATPATGESK